MSIEKAKNGYRVRVYYYNVEKDKRVQYSSKIVETKRAAKELEAQLLKELTQDKITALIISKNNNTDKIIFSEIILEFLKDQETYLSKSTYITKKRIINNYLTPFFKDYDIRLIDKNMVRLFKDTLIQKKLSSNVIRIYMNILSQILDFCVEYYQLNSNVLN